MALKNKTILIVSPEGWGEVFVSKHNYAINLAEKGNMVFFLNPPSQAEFIAPTKYHNLFEVNYKGFFRGIRFFPSFFQKKVIYNKFKELEKMARVKFDVIWSFDNSVFFDFSGFPKDILKICHIVDLNQDFQVEKLASTANICFCTTEYIKNRLVTYNKRVYKINHGNQDTPCASIQELPGKNKIKAVYVGNLAIPYFDWKLLFTVVSENSDVDFIMIGPDKGSHLQKTIRDVKNEIKKLPNINFIGPIPSANVLEFLRGADILLIMYLADKYKEQLANPHKLMQYFSAGKVVVSTWTEEYKNNRNLIEMVEKNADYPALFKKVVSRISDYNCVFLQEEKRKFALDNTYEKQVARIEWALNSL